MSKHDGHDHDHELDDDDDDGTVTLVDADGNEATFGILEFVEHDGNEYALLAPIEQLTSDDDEGPLDVFIYRYEEFEDGETFSPVDGEEFEAVKALAAELLKPDEDGEE